VYSIKIIISSFLVLTGLLGFSQNRTLNAFRTDEKIHIDGVLNETAWEQADSTDNFVIYEPNFGESPNFNTKIKLLYDNKALYIAAILYDETPENILKEFTRRDVDNGNTDLFWISLNPNNDGLNMYEFKVTASNVQTDVRISDGDQDYNWDAVWESGVNIHDEGWTVEIKIPYSAIRFPEKPVQSWDVNFWRQIRRTRETSSWQAVDQTKGNRAEQMGTITNLKNLNPPVRLAFYPYLTGNVTKHSNANNWSYGFGGGLDMKLGLSKSHTLDLTLIPDFSQVKSDDLELNLTPFETYYDENRPFFTEGTELFQKADLFYSRRIGKIPEKYHEVQNLSNDNYQIIKNPRYSSLLNAVKLSGRGENNLAVGFLNAITANTYAEVINPDGDTEQILTEPWANYNILVLDQAFNNNSYLNFTNTRVDRPDNKYHANVAGIAWRIMEKQNKFGILGNSAWSNIKDSISENDSLSNGFKFYAEMGKLNGEWQYDYYTYVVSDSYEQNDLGYLSANNDFQQGIELSYNKYEKFGGFNKTQNTLGIYYTNRYKPFAYKSFHVGLFSYAETRKYLSIWNNLRIKPFEIHDYNEARSAGRVFKRAGISSEDIYLSTDYRKTLALDLKVGAMSDFTKRYGFYGRTFLRYRINDKINLRAGVEYDLDYNNVGYVASFQTNQEILFANRDVETYVQNISFNWVFTNKMYLSLSLRHYWRTVDYLSFALLKEDGYLGEPYNNEFANANIDDINFNTFNLDILYSWNFAPGSFLSVNWKSNGFSSERIPEHLQFPSYSENMLSIVNNSYSNTLSVRLLYYFDWHYLTH
jgi:hypothetical protein